MASRMDEFSHYNLPINGNSYDFDATALFERAILDYPFKDFLKIAKKNSEGRIWIIGGFVYRNIVKELYPETPYEKRPIDIDFLVEAHKVEEIFCPRGWKSKRTAMGDLSLEKRNKYRIDLNGLVNFHSISSNNLPPEIQYFYERNPLNIQAISYDCEKRIVEGEEAIDAIRNKRVEIEYIKEALWEADRISKKIGKPFSVNDLVRRKADELGFDYTLPPGFDYELPE